MAESAATAGGVRHPSRPKLRQMPRQSTRSFAQRRPWLLQCPLLASKLLSPRRARQRCLEQSQRRRNRGLQMGLHGCGPQPLVPRPLAAAAGPDERRRLKRAAERPAGDADEPRAVSQAAVEARAACSSVSVAAMVAVWSRCEGSGLDAVHSAGRQAAAPSSRAAGTAGGAAGSSALPGAEPLPAFGSEQPVPVQPVQQLSFAKRARLASAVQAGPPALCWQPYASHMALRLGRSGLWCLSCFSQPVGDYRVWLRGRCSDERPPSAAPSSLSAALLRARDLDANASEALRRRHAVLLASARVVPVPRAALAGFQAGGRLGTGASGLSPGGNQGA